MKSGNTDFEPMAHRLSKSTLSHDRLFALLEISKKINQVSDLQKLLDQILRSALSSIGAGRGMIILADELGEHYQTVASESLEDDISFSRSIVEKTLESNRTLMSEDLRLDPRFKDADSVKTLNIISFICVPLIIPGRSNPLGTLYVDQRIYKRTFTDEDRSFLEAFANLAAIAISNASQMEQLVSNNIQLREEVSKQYGFPGIIGRSKVMQKVIRAIKLILNDDCTVLLTGESGSGKEVIAKAIHYNSNRKERPFLAINCGALPETILEAELFGSVRGAFTGAVDKKGLFQAAHGGTLFMDEIHHTSEAMQVKLLRVLQEKEIRRVGGTKALSINVRLICATNEDLQKAVGDGHFRQDFYYRINVVTIDVPALRDHKDDIPLLAHYFLEKRAEEKGKHFQGFDKDALEALMRYDWTENNVRELQNEIERAVIFAKDSTTMKLSHLSAKLQSGVISMGGVPDFLVNDKGVPLTYQELEKKYISFILSQVAGNKSKAARIMGVPRSTLQGKMRKFGLK